MSDAKAVPPEDNLNVVVLVGIAEPHAFSVPKDTLVSHFYNDVVATDATLGPLCAGGSVLFDLYGKRVPLDLPCLAIPANRHGTIVFTLKPPARARMIVCDWAPIALKSAGDEDPWRKIVAAIMARTVSVTANCLTATETWPGATNNVLFVRKYYKPLFESILQRFTGKELRSVIVGQPGIGKSVFMWYIIYRILTEREHGDHRPVVFIGDCEKNCKIILAGSVYEIDKLLYEDLEDDSRFDDAIFLFDAVKPSLMHRYTLVVASVQIKRCWRDQNLFNEFGATIVMPAPTNEEVEELRSLAFPAVTPEQMEKRMQLWGPIPRFVLVNISPKEQREQWTRIQSIPLEDVLAVANGWDPKTTTDGDFCHRFLIERALGEDADEKLTITDGMFYSRGAVHLASLTMARLVVEKMISLRRWDAACLVDTTANIAGFSILRGLAFENISLGIIADGGTFNVRRLSPIHKGVQPVHPATSIVVQPTKQAMFSDLEELTALAAAEPHRTFVALQEDLADIHGVLSLRNDGRLSLARATLSAYHYCLGGLGAANTLAALGWSPCAAHPHAEYYWLEYYWLVPSNVFNKWEYAIGIGKELKRDKRKRARCDVAFDPTALENSLIQYALEIPQDVAFSRMEQFCKDYLPDPEALMDEVLAL